MVTIFVKDESLWYLLRQRHDKIRILLVKGIWGTLDADKEKNQILERDNYQAASGIFHSHPFNP
jgi:hypothetical protein